MRATPIITLALCVGALTPAVRAQGAPAVRASPIAAAPAITEAVVEGTNVRRMQAETVLHAPFESAVARLLAFERYPEFMRRFRSARIVRRNRATSDVYFQLELPRAMGVVWFLHRLTVVSRSANRLEISGVSLGGNLGRVETRTVLERLPGPAAEARFTFELFGIPLMPALSDTVNTTLRDAVRGASTLLRTCVETDAARTPSPH